jgi:serine/threonine-protein kinase
MPLVPGDRMGPYEIRARIGAGGMGEVYSALDTRLNRTVAIKVLPEAAASGPERARFEREAQAVAALSHPNVLSVFDVGTEGDTFFIVTELLEGKTLREQLRSGAIPPGKAVEYTEQAAAALQAAHAKGIIHRDIKPENLFVLNDGRIKVLDFGLARLVHHEHFPAEQHTQLTAPDTVLGTVGYMSPEQLRGEPVDHRSDIFSLGCVLFEMLSGRPPFLKPSPTATIAAILNDSPDLHPLRDVPPVLRGVVERCLAKNPADRYESARQLAADLKAHSTDSMAHSPTVAMSVPPSAPARRITLPVAISALAVAGALIAAIVFGFRSRNAPETQPSAAARKERAMIAILPFENLSGDPSQEYFSDGLTEDTTTEFGRLSPERLGVIARTSVMRYKHARNDVRSIGRELGVDYLIEGSVRRAGNRVRVAAQLIRASDGTQVWAETYDRTLDDVLAMQSELARGVAAAVQIKVIPSSVIRQAATPATDAGRDAYLRGRYHLALGTPQDRRKAVEYLKQALASDPNSALVNTEMARALLSLSTLDYAPREIVPKAREAVEKALQLDDTVAEAHEVFGTMLLEYYWNWPEAEREIRRAIELNPNLARAHAVYATLLISSGRIDEGLQHSARARALDPLAPAQHRNSLLQLFVARRWNEAIDQSRKVIDLEPKYDFAWAVMGLAQLALGKNAEALASADKVVAMTTVPVPRAIAAYVYARAGHEDKARSLLTELEAAAEKRFVCFFNVATVHAALGEKENAISALERAFIDRSG